MTLTEVKDELTALKTTTRKVIGFFGDYDNAVVDLALVVESLIDIVEKMIKHHDEEREALSELLNYYE